MKMSLSVLPLLALSLAGCSLTPVYAPSLLGKTYASRTPADKIEVFRSTAPERPAEEIGSVSVCCGHDHANLLNYLRAEASARGGDALTGFDVTAEGAAIATVLRYR